MNLFVILLSVISVSYTVHGFPQSAGSDVLSAKELINTADSSRYGQDPSGQVTGDTQDLLDDIFGDGDDYDDDLGKNADLENEDCVPDDLIEDVFSIPGTSIRSPKATLTDNRFSNCTSYEEYGFFCVPFNQCEEGFILQDGAGLIDIRSALQPSTSKCFSDFEVCCRDEEYADVPLPSFEPVTTTTARPRPVTCKTPTTTTPKPTTSSTTTANPKVPDTQQPKCGQRHSNGVGVRILNDDKSRTQFGEWPHMCAVLKEQQLGGKDVNLYVCGGSLIAKNLLLTAAHCVDDHIANPSLIKVRCGEWDTQQAIEPLVHQDRTAKKISLHPLYKPQILHDDYALIHLESDFELAGHINPICLPSQDSLNDLDFSSEKCVATGWGKDKYGKEGRYQVTLKQVEMNLVDHSECQARLRKTKLGRRYKLDESLLCAGGEPGQDTCKGDGGGPLVCPRYSDPQQYVQAGIVAFGVGCGNNVPGVYANVSQALCFIDWATKCADGFDVDYFGYTGCQDWGKRQYCQYKDELAIVSAKDGRLARRQQARLETSVENLENALRSCDRGPYSSPDKEIDCTYFGDYTYDDVDLGGFERAADDLS